MPFFVPLLMAAGKALATSAATAAIQKGVSGSSKSRATDTLRGVNTPTADQLTLPKLQEYVQQGLITPEQVQTFLQEESAYNTVQTDPRLRGSQIDALTQLEGISDAGGMDAMAKAGLEDVLGRQRTESRGAQEAIMANARARGVYGSDLEMVNRMVAQQSAAQAGSRNALDVGAIAQQRRDAALAQSADLAGNIRGADFSEAARKAEAADAINRFNAANRQDVATLNVGARNAAQVGNLAQKQSIANQNVGLANERTKYNAGVPQDVYNNEFRSASAIADSQDQTAKYKQSQDAGQANQATSLLSTFATLYGKKKDEDAMNSGFYKGENTGGWS